MMTKIWPESEEEAIQYEIKRIQRGRKKVEDWDNGRRFTPLIPSLVGCIIMWVYFAFVLLISSPKNLDVMIILTVGSNIFFIILGIQQIPITRKALDESDLTWVDGYSK